MATLTTCGKSCWEAHYTLCVCSCNGRNHGIAYSEGDDIPERLKQRDGQTYSLYSVVPTYQEAVLEVARLTDNAYIAHLSRASLAQLSWPEFADGIDSQGRRPYGIWVLQVFIFIIKNGLWFFIGLVLLVLLLLLFF